MAVHAGEAEQRDDDWFGTTINRAARLLELGHGGQILVSGVVAALTDDMPIDGCTLLDLGVHPLRDLAVPEHVFQVARPGSEPAGASVAAATPKSSHALCLGGGRRSLAAGELERAPAVIDDHRLISLVGVGGIGKTRLAEEIPSGGRRRREVWWVDLTRADHAEESMPSCRRDERPGVPGRRSGRRRRGALIVLDGGCWWSTIANTSWRRSRCCRQVARCRRVARGVGDDAGPWPRWRACVALGAACTCRWQGRY